MTASPFSWNSILLKWQCIPLAVSAQAVLQPPRPQYGNHWSLKRPPLLRANAPSQLPTEPFNLFAQNKNLVQASKLDVSAMVSGPGLTLSILNPFMVLTTSLSSLQHSRKALFLPFSRNTKVKNNHIRVHPFCCSRASNQTSFVASTIPSCPRGSRSSYMQISNTSFFPASKPSPSAESCFIWVSAPAYGLIFETHPTFLTYKVAHRIVRPKPLRKADSSRRNVRDQPSGFHFHESTLKEVLF